MDEAQKVENDGYSAFCVRILRKLAWRVGEGNPEDLEIFRVLREELDLAEGEAIARLGGNGHSYTEMGRALRQSKQAVHQKHTRRLAQRPFWK